jgi:hypothetical protein
MEVKMAGSLPDVVDQLMRYADHPDVHATLLATTSSRLAASLPAEIRGKPALAVVLSGGVL